MNKIQDASFSVLYSARHQRCGRSVERTDFRVVTQQDLFRWSQDFVTADSFQPLPLHCDVCAEEVLPTHVRITKDVDSMTRTVVPEVEITKFNPDDWRVAIEEII